MKVYLIILIFTFKSSLALECTKCNYLFNDPSKKCENSMKCKNGIEMCETLVSKVNGEYSISMSCATKDKCGLDSVFNEGLEECLHQKDDTECYSCCDHDNCNTLEAALKKLPKDILDAEKVMKLADENLAAIEKGEDEYVDETTDTIYDGDEIEDEEEEEITTKKSKNIKKATTVADDEEIDTTTKKIKTTKKMPTTTVKSTTSKFNSTTAKPFNKSTKGHTEKVPKINIDGRQIAFNPNFTSTTTKSTTTKELEINDIAKMIFPDQKNSSEEQVKGYHEAFKGAASGFKISLFTFLLCLTARHLF